MLTICAIDVPPGVAGSVLLFAMRYRSVYVCVWAGGGGISSEGGLADRGTVKRAAWVQLLAPCWLHGLAVCQVA